MKNKNVDLYKLLNAAYNGDGGFRDGGYLVQHPRESNEKYQMRKTLAHYLNYTKPCVDAHVSPIFKTMAVRDYKGAASGAWEIFAKDVDFLGTSIDKLMKKAAYVAKLNGVAYIVMDRAEEIKINSLADVEANRNNLPYAFVVDASSVVEVKLDKFGRITKFVFSEPDPDNKYEPAKRTLTADGWELKTSKGETRGTWDLGCVPVARLFSKEHRSNDAFPPSEFESIARTNLAIYNMSSWLSDILVNQTFSVLTYPSNDEEAIEIGTNNALSYPADSTHAPSFIAPSSEPANILISQISALQQEIYRMAVVVNVTGVRSQQSGEAKAWDYEATNQILSDFADMVEGAEKQVARLFAVWVGADLEYKVSYPSDFKISEVEQELANAEVAKGLNFGDEFNMQVFKRVLTAYLPELPDDEFDKIVKAYEQKQKEEKLDLMNVGGNDGGQEGQQGTEPNNSIIQ